MNEVNVYAVYDTVQGMYDIPFFARNDLFARRRFIIDVINREKNPLLAHFSEDFHLICLGTYDQKSGRFKGHDVFPLVITGKQATEVKGL